VIINSPTTHGAIGFSTDLTPSMTLGCGSWGGNVTSDNVSPIHLMDIKRVAFETKPVGSSYSSVVISPSAVANSRPSLKREDIASIVDKFLSQKLASSSVPATPTKVEIPVVETSTKAIIHEIMPEETKVSQATVSFVSENDVKDAIARSEKIFVNSKTIITPSARDIGDDVIAWVG
jgi:acetaldehyde dehydrogenase (acetylating)